MSQAWTFFVPNPPAAPAAVQLLGLTTDGVSADSSPGYIEGLYASNNSEISLTNLTAAEYLAEGDLIYVFAHARDYTNAGDISIRYSPEGEYAPLDEVATGWTFGKVVYGGDVGPVSTLFWGVHAVTAAEAAHMLADYQNIDENVEHINWTVTLPTAVLNDFGSGPMMEYTAVAIRGADPATIPDPVSASSLNETTHALPAAVDGSPEAGQQVLIVASNNGSAATGLWITGRGNGLGDDPLLISSNFGFTSPATYDQTTVWFQVFDPSETISSEPAGDVGILIFPLLPLSE